jgi:uncharacterized membrane protein
MSPDILSVATIILMAVITFATRYAGVFLAGKFVLKGRAKAAFEAIPPAVLMAVIAPSVLATGWPETIASVITAFAALRLPLLAAIIIGVGSIVMLRLAA